MYGLAARLAFWVGPLAGLLAGLLVVLAGCSTPHLPAPQDISPPERSYAEALQARAAALRLWDDPYWHLLMHYRPGVLSGVTSEADGGGFFLAPEGKTDPRAELEATLLAFFSETILEPGQMTAQCTFVARYAWLDEQLGFDGERMPVQECARYRAWRTAIDPESVTLVYASYYFNNPSSMFGHTLLRFDKGGRESEQRLLDYSVTFGAVVNADDNEVVWALKGVFGGYEGVFSVFPYYIKVREYNDVEDRDLWEYRLALTPQEIDQLLRHLWEMGSTSFDYYFFKENCSYHLLSLLEVARPEVDLRSRFFVWTLPTETVQSVLSESRLVDRVTYRYSQGTSIQWNLSRMTPEQRDAVFALAEAGPVADADPAMGADAGEAAVVAETELAGLAGLAEKPTAYQATVLDTAIEIHQRETSGEPNPSRETRLAQRRLLLARSRLDYREPVPPPPRPAAPLSGPRNARIFLARGEGELGADAGQRGFYELRLEPSFHELLTREEGYAPNSQIHGLALRLRYEDETEAVRVERFDLGSIVSLVPLTRLSKQFSWKLRFGWERSRDLMCKVCTPFVLDGGVGLALQSHLVTREVYFAFLEPTVQVDGRFEHGYRVAYGGSVGLLFEITPAYRAGLMATQTVYFAGDSDEDGPSQVESARVTQRLSLGMNTDLRLEWRAVEDYREASLGLSIFF